MTVGRGFLSPMTLALGALLPTHGYGAECEPQQVSYGPVKAGENLWRIAFNHRADNGNVESLLAAIFQANPQAFSNDSFNSLQIGSTLLLPISSCGGAPNNDAPTERDNEVAAGREVTQPSHQHPTPGSESVSSADTREGHPAVKQVTVKRSESRAAALPPLPPIASIATPKQASSSWQVDGSLSAEGRVFLDQPSYAQQGNESLSLSTQIAAYYPWNDEQAGVSMRLFGRADSVDSRRTHWDIRELKYFHVGDGWEVHGGIDKVFWGQTESLHLVDVINQTDGIEHPDMEDKLGQPMVRFATLGDWGALDVFILPYFRERTFAGAEGRLRLPSVINTEADGLYESDEGQNHIDYALRWAHMWGDVEFALSAFDGTAREPLLVPDPLNPASQLRPFYPQMTQYGVEGLYLTGDWIWKAEAIHRQGNLFEDFTAVVAGFEHTFYGVTDSAMDIGVLMEYQYDSRNEHVAVLGQNDLFVGARLAFNDIDGSEILSGWVQDLDNRDSWVFLLEGRTRLSANWTANIDIWLFNSKVPQDPIYFIRQDDFVQVTFSLHF